MDKQEILDEIEKTKEHLANLEKKLQECEYKRWKPKGNEKYWYISDDNTINYSLFMPEIQIDNMRFKNYNCFSTREQAEAEAENILVRRQLEDMARRLNKGQKIDWDNKDQIKYAIHFNFYLDRIDSFYRLFQKEQGTVYCLDKKFLDVAIREIGEERLKAYLRGE